MKNLTVYVGTVKRCLDLENYKKDGDSTFIPDCEFGSIQMGFAKPNTETINNQAILIQKNNHFYEFKITNTFFDNFKIIFDLGNCMWSKPYNNGDLFCVKETLTPYYEEQPKKLSFRKLKQDLLYDSRIKTGIEH